MKVARIVGLIVMEVWCPRGAVTDSEEPRQGGGQPDIPLHPSPSLAGALVSGRGPPPRLAIPP
jgi:hypothetical protein